MRALVTGIEGFVGPYLARALLAHGYQVSGFVHDQLFDRLPPSLKQEEFQAVDLFPFDLSDQEGIKKGLQRAEPDIIFHLAGYSSVRGSFLEPELTYQTNCRGIENLLEAIRKVQPASKLIFAGSADEFGLQIASEAHYQWALNQFRTIFPPPMRVPELPINETNPLRPLSPYAVSKVYGDHLTRNYWSSYGLNTVVARLFNHEGAGRAETYVTSSLIRQCIQAVNGELDAIQIGNVCAFRDWSHVEDIVEGYLALSEFGTPGDVYVMGSRRMHSVLTYLLLGLSELGCPVQALETLDGDKRVEAPMEIDLRPYLGLEFEKLRVDDLMLNGGLCYDLKDSGLNLYTPQGMLKVMFDPGRYRPADVPLLISDPTKAEKLGFRITRSLQDIVHDQVAYFKNFPSLKS